METTYFRSPVSEDAPRAGNVVDKPAVIDTIPVVQPDEPPVIEQIVAKGEAPENPYAERPDHAMDETFVGATSDDGDRDAEGRPYGPDNPCGADCAMCETVAPSGVVTETSEEPSLLARIGAFFARLWNYRGPEGSWIDGVPVYRHGIMLAAIIAIVMSIAALTN